jgi:hypothetical protein
MQSSDKICSLKLYHLLNFTLYSKANACNIDTYIRFYMQKLLSIEFIQCATLLCEWSMESIGKCFGFFSTLTLLQMGLCHHDYCRVLSKQYNSSIHTKKYCWMSYSSASLSLAIFCNQLFCLILQAFALECRVTFSRW